MRPEIQYVASADGTSIAYLFAGQGTPAVFLRPGAGHLELDWDNAAYRRQFEWFASRFRLILFDLRGTGLSERGPVEHTLDRWLEDLDAVLARVGGDEYVIVTVGPSSTLALAAAHRWPERISRLVLWNPFSPRDAVAIPGVATLRALLDTNWEIYTETYANLIYGWSAEVARARAAALRASITQDGMKALQEAMNGMEVEHLLPAVTTPTLVIVPRDALLGAPDSSRRIASRLPNARFATVPGAFVAMSFDDAQRTGAIADFLGVSPGQPVAPPAAMHETSVILFADVVDSTGLTERLGDDVFRARARDLDVRLRAIVRESSGRPVDGKLLGDGVLALFPSAREAIAGALRCHEVSAALGLPLHIGIHAGDVIREADDVHGGAVNLAARVAAAAAPGEILVTDTVRALARTSTQAVFEDRGRHALKGVAEPQQLFAVRTPAV